MSACATTRCSGQVGSVHFWWWHLLVVRRRVGGCDAGTRVRWKRSRERRGASRRPRLLEVTRCIKSSQSREEQVVQQRNLPALDPTFKQLLLSAAVTGPAASSTTPPSFRSSHLLFFFFPLFDTPSHPSPSIRTMDRNFHVGDAYQMYGLLSLSPLPTHNSEGRLARAPLAQAQRVPSQN